jgi:hypothetical protein
MQVASPIGGLRLASVSLPGAREFLEKRSLGGRQSKIIIRENTSRAEEVFVEPLEPVLKGYLIAVSAGSGEKMCVDQATTKGDALAAFARAYGEASKDTTAEGVGCPGATMATASSDGDEPIARLDGRPHLGEPTGLAQRWRSAGADIGRGQVARVSAQDDGAAGDH